MNIDIVNNKVAKELNISEKKVKDVNDFFWRNVYDSFYSYTEKPINIENVCVFYPNCYMLKKEILLNITKIRKIQNNKYLPKDSIKRQNMIMTYTVILRKLLRIRKLNKYTN